MLNVARVCFVSNNRCGIFGGMNMLTLKQEVTLLRSAVISIVGQDAEGSYRPEFVESTFAALQRMPTKQFVSSKQFLADIAKQESKRRAS